MEANWNKVLEVIREQISTSNYKVWFSDTKLDPSSNGVLKIRVPDAFRKNNLTTRYAPIIENAIFKVFGKNITYQLVIDTSLQKPRNKTGLEELDIPTIIKPNLVNIGLNPKYTLTSFVVGLSNNLAFAAAQAVIANPGLSYNPLFIYGGTGVGKTHLMQAIGNQLITLNQDLKIIYCSSEKFTNDFIASIQNKKTFDFRNRYRSVDLLLIDDIQFIAGRDSTQEEFFHTFNELHSKNAQIILTSDRPPYEMQKLESRLQSRFQGGLMVDIQMPDFDTRVAILKAKCLERSEIIDEQILTLIAEYMPTNAREIEGKLIQILETIKLQGIELNIENVKSLLGQPKQSQITLIEPKKLISIIASYFNIKLSDITGPSRKKDFVLPRQIAMYLLYQKNQIPYEKIGELLGGRDHTTILHGVDKINKAINRDREIQKMIIEVQNLS